MSCRGASDLKRNVDRFCGDLESGLRVDADGYDRGIWSALYVEDASGELAVQRDFGFCALTRGEASLHTSTRFGIIGQELRGLLSYPLGSATDAATLHAIAEKLRAMADIFREINAMPLVE
jgi:hypothetical protein